MSWNCMVDNFIREYDTLNGTAIMGIYGDAHADPSDESVDDNTHYMAFQLREYYGDIIQYESIVTLTKWVIADLQEQLFSTRKTAALFFCPSAERVIPHDKTTGEKQNSCSQSLFLPPFPTGRSASKTTPARMLMCHKVTQKATDSRHNSVKIV